MKAHLPHLALLLLAVGVATWPLLGELGATAVGHPYGDMADHYWGTWWVARRLLGGQLPLTTDVSHYPETLSLWYVDTVGALLVLPLRVLGDPAAWNLLVFGQVLLATGAAYYLGWDGTGDRRAGLVAAMVAGPSPYALGLVHSGLSEYLGLAPVTLFVAFTLRALDLDGRGRPGKRHHLVLAAACLGFAGAQALYYFVFGALFLAVAVPGPGWARRGSTALRVLVGATVLAGPFAAASLSAIGEGAAVTQANAPGWVSRLPATDLLTFVRPGAYYFPDTPAAGNPGILHVNYLGWVAILLAVAGGRAAWTRAGLAWAVLSLGPRLAWAKTIVTVGGVSVLLPLGFLYFPGSPVAWVHQPYRLVALLLPVLALGAARGSLRLPSWARLAAAGAVLAETLLVSPAPWPLTTREVGAPAVYATLPPGPVLDWPPDGSTWNRDYLVWAVEHGRPVPYGVNVFLGEELRRDPLVDGLLRAIERVDHRARNRDVPFQGRVLLRPKGSTSRLAELGFVAVVVHKDALSDREWGKTRALLRAAFGEPTTEDTEVAAWTPR